MAVARPSAAGVVPGVISWGVPWFRGAIPAAHGGVMEFLVELYVARGGLAAHRDARLASRAAADLFDHDSDVRCLKSIVVLEDETCFLLVEAATAAAVRGAVERAGLRCEHVSAAAST